MSAFFLDGFAHVSEMLSGQDSGARDKQGFITQIKDSTQIAGVTAMLLGSGIMLFAPLVISFITKDAQVQAIAEQHSVYAGIYIIVSFVAFQLDGVFIGATRSKEMRNTSIISLLVLIGTGTVLTQRSEERV